MKAALQGHPVCARCYKHLIGSDAQWRDLFPLNTSGGGVQRYCCFCDKPTEGGHLEGRMEQCGKVHT